MRRSKVKATVCLGRRKPDVSKKPKEISEEKSDTNPVLERLIEKTESISSENIPTSAHMISSKTSDETDLTQSSMKQIIPSSNLKPSLVDSSSINEGSEPLNSLSSAVTSQISKDESFSEVDNTCTSVNIISSHNAPLIPQNLDTVTSSTNTQEKPHVPSNRSIFNRSKIKAVPKMRVRKTASDTNLENAKEKSSSVTTLVEVSNIEEKETAVSDQEKQAPKNSYVPPLSPTKLCRNKIKVVPILGNRRYPTADLDDLNKKNNSRVRTDSQSSTISGIQEITDDQTSTQKKVENNLDFKRKIKKSEGSKKLAEARKEFSKKFSDSKPDYKKLTMMDLIFYNPTTNPMKYEDKKHGPSKQISDSIEEAEDVDNPAEPTNDEASQNDDEQTEKSEDEDEIVAPRIKVGPNGEIILDEKSLVIENKKAKKAAEAIEKSKLHDGDVDRPYGVFKRFKRTKWSHSETLKFYRALSSVGTDFTLMTELFPKRTRRELKLKFKREEKDNRELVDQAIMKPCSFNFAELKAEFKIMEIEEHEIEQQQLNKKELMKKRQDKKTRKWSKLMEDDTTHSSESVLDNDITVEKANETTKRKREKKSKPLPRLPNPHKKMDILSALSEGEDSGDDTDNDSEVSFVLPVTHTTRYGRKTKRREIFEPNLDLDEEVIIQKRIRTTNPEPEPVQKPGSLMVVSSETSDGQPLVKIFMVTDDQDENSEDPGNKNLLPIAMIRTGNPHEEEVIENNYTIPADIEENNLEKPVEDKEDHEREEDETNSVISEEQK